ncbi:hypothetical protein AB0C11_37110 [Streptomyces sp. NPDC039016]|uniref:hypothetical protein n=1 Tax=Streptomyces sp. NPDC039016 TaxID=3154330 RepID=UPI00340C0DC9
MGAPPYAVAPFPRHLLEPAMSAAFSRPSAVQAPRLRKALPWWGLALPVVSFVALLVLVVSPGEASAAAAARAPESLAPLLEFLARVLRLGG